MEQYTCKQCSNHMNSMQDVAKHLRKECIDRIDIRAFGRPGQRDTHGHLWYCFSCEIDWKDHRSFNSNVALLQHLSACHNDMISRGHLYCLCDGPDYSNDICGYCNLRL